MSCAKKPGPSSAPNTHGRHNHGAHDHHDHMIIMIIMITLDVTEECTDMDHAMITLDDVEAFLGSGTEATRLRRRHHRCRRRF